MTTPARTDIRSAFATLLTGLTTTGSRVYVARTRPLEATEVPCLCIFSGEAEPVGALMAGNRPDLYRYELRVDIFVKATSGAENTADTILGEIDAKLFASQSANRLSGKCAGIMLKAIGSPDVDDSADRPVLRLPVLFETLYPG